MKIGIISDIHSNIDALKAVLNEFDKNNIEKIICCGDIIGIGAFPEETVQLLLKKKDKLIAVRGNHEQYLLNGLPKEIHDNKRAMSQNEIQNHKWTHSQLSDVSIKFLSSLPVKIFMEIENKKLYVVHYPLEDDNTYKKHIKNPNLRDSRLLFSNINADIFLFGHNHTYGINSEKNNIYINPGSIGCPMSNNVAHAVMLNISNKKVDFKHIEVEYDTKAVIKKIQKMKFPFYDSILKIFYGQN